MNSRSSRKVVFASQRSFNRQPNYVPRNNPYMGYYPENNDFSGNFMPGYQYNPYHTRNAQGYSVRNNNYQQVEETGQRSKNNNYKRSQKARQQVEKSGQQPNKQFRPYNRSLSRAKSVDEGYRQQSNNTSNNTPNSNSKPILDNNLFTTSCNLPTASDEMKLIGYGYENDLLLYTLKLQSTNNNNVDNLFKLNFEFLKEKYKSVKRDITNDQRELEIEQFWGYILSAIINGPTKLVLFSSKNLNEMLKSLEKSRDILNDVLRKGKENNTKNPKFTQYKFVKSLGSVINTSLQKISSGNEEDIYINELSDIQKPFYNDNTEISNNEWYHNPQSQSLLNSSLHPVLFLPIVTINLNGMDKKYGDISCLIKYYLASYFIFIKENYQKNFEDLCPSGSSSKIQEDYLHVKVNYFILILLIKTILLKEPNLLEFLIETYEVSEKGDDGTTRSITIIKDQNIGMYLHKYSDITTGSLNYSKNDSELIKFNKLRAFNNTNNKSHSTSEIPSPEDLIKQGNRMTLELIRNSFMSIKMNLTQFIMAITNLNSSQSTSGNGL